ncbi:MAG: hypothetical protein DSY83_03690 [Flavobacteriia bacterium]|nr:MAG: hypothetical protein DSY83_03690 [Flavobacteriia bacterium]
MSRCKVHTILESKYGTEIADKLLDSYKEIEENYVLQKWKPSELDAGHFVESARRILEIELFGNATSYNDKLANFSDQVLKGYENCSGIHESYRILIPRTLKAIFNIRNKRGVGHVGAISPNKMDATYIFYSVKWVLAEIVRLASGLSISDTQELIDKIIERNLDLIWKEDGFERILDTKLPAKDQVLILLFDSSPREIEDMRSIIEYKNRPNFSQLVLKPLHKERLIEMRGDGTCDISPKGILEAEKIILKLKY